MRFQYAYGLVAAVSAIACGGMDASMSGAGGASSESTTATSSGATSSNGASSSSASSSGASGSSSASSGSGGGHPGDCVGAQGQPTDCSELADACHDAHCDAKLHACVVADKSGPCDDKNPCTQTDQCIAGACVGFPIPGCCAPSCQGKTCGDDGCGGSCGACKPSEVCAAGLCVPPPPESDTCANVPAITLPYKHLGSTMGLQNDLAAPQNSCGQTSDLGLYAPDAVYRYHATKDGVIAVSLTKPSYDADVYVVTDCADPKYTCVAGVDSIGAGLGPIYARVAQGKDYFIVVDGDGTQAGTYELDVTDCVPDCNGKQCGTDGCGGSCGDCAPKFYGVCSNVGTCACLADCNDRECGTDGCGGSCGACSGGQACTAIGHCATPNQPGDSCADATAVTSFPFSFAGSTVGFGNDVFAWAFCQGDGTGAYLGLDAPDRVFAVHAQVATTYHFEITQASFQSSLYVITDCADVLSCEEAGYEAFTGREQLVFEVPAGGTAYVVVDGYSTESGSFTLIGERCDQPGACSAGEPGEFCSSAIVAPALPYAAQGVVGALDSYHLDAGGSCNVPKRVGAGNQDVAYAFTAPKDGSYTVQVKPNGAQLDPLVYVATDCNALQTACVAWSDQGGAGATEKLTFAGTAGTTYYVVVDAFTQSSVDFGLTIDGPP